MLNLTQDRDIHCMYPIESHGKGVILLYFFIISLNILVETFSGKCNTKKKRVGGAN